jgi:hypothetical protein
LSLRSLIYCGPCETFFTQKEKGVLNSSPLALGTYVAVLVREKIFEINLLLTLIHQITSLMCENRLEMYYGDKAIEKGLRKNWILQ